MIAYFHLASQVVSTNEILVYHFLLTALKISATVQ